MYYFCFQEKQKDLYKQFIRPVLFLFDAEKAHHITFSAIKISFKIPFFKSIFRYFYNIPIREKIELFGLTFNGRVGLAAGLDKNAVLINNWADFGFSFIEIGTVTPLAQEGNDKPRLFRLVNDHAIINRMGFNNDGVLVISERLKKRNKNIIIGGNIGKNKITPNEDAEKDYVKCFSTLFDVVDFFTVNVSSPNTPELRALQEKNNLIRIFNSLNELNTSKNNPKPILLKIAPDLTYNEIDDILYVAEVCKISGLIISNTTIERNQLITDKLTLDNIGNGGLSGIPLRKKSTEVIHYVNKKTNGKLPIIGVGGIFTAEDALEKIAAGASLVQVYSGLIYEGPELVKNINKALSKPTVSTLQ